jgi:nitrogen fixation NifU-like protein
MSDARDLYQELIKDHSKKPRNFRVLEQQGVRHIEGYNPLCGDRFTIYLQMDGDVVQDVSFKGAGCAISTASASLMTQALKGKTRAEAEALFHKFHEFVTGAASAEEETDLGKLEVFAGVRNFPARVKCATLAWHTFHAALEGKQQTISTE